MLRLLVKEIAQEKGISQGRLSRMANIDPKAISTIYHNPYVDIRLSTLDKLSRALKVPVQDLYIREGED